MKAKKNFLHYFVTKGYDQIPIITLCNPLMSLGIKLLTAVWTLGLW